MCTPRTAEVFKDRPVLPMPKPMRTVPVVPSTPLPTETLGGSPAWDPSSRTPLWHDRRADEGESSYPGHSQPLIPKPHGRLNRSKEGYNHKQSLNLGDDLYAKITVSANANRNVSSTKIPPPLESRMPFN
jgi:hypothetical protein